MRYITQATRSTTAGILIGLPHHPDLNSYADFPIERMRTTESVSWSRNLVFSELLQLSCVNGVLYCSRRSLPLSES